MASGGSMMNGDISRSSSQSGTLEETLEQMNVLIQENRDLKGKSGCVVVDWKLKIMFFIFRFLFVVAGLFNNKDVSSSPP